MDQSISFKAESGTIYEGSIVNIRDFCSNDEQAVCELCQEAFKGYPWFENMSDGYIRDRWHRHSGERNFYCILIESEKRVIAATWFHDLSPEKIRDQKGKDLYDFVATYKERQIVWIDASVTHPAFQGRGLATTLKHAALKKISALHISPIVLTRMRDDNHGIIKVNERFGFVRTGIKIPGKGGMHEFWYRI